MGFRRLVDRADAQLIGGIYHDGFVRLIDRHDEDGNCWPGRLAIPTIINTLGAGSFDAGTEAPWQHLIASQSQFGAVLNTAWTKYEQFYQDSGLARSEKGDGMLIAQPVTRAGFYEDGKCPSKITKAITDELEQARYEILDQEIKNKPIDDPERWAWCNSDSMSGLALENVPDSLGRLSDDAIIDTFASYMGQKWPAAREHVGNYFGKGGEQLDEYGHNLAAARLPGAGFRVLHNDAVHLTRSMMREAGFVSDSEAWNMFQFITVSVSTFSACHSFLTCCYTTPLCESLKFLN